MPLGSHSSFIIIIFYFLLALRSPFLVSGIPTSLAFCIHFCLFFRSHILSLSLSVSLSLSLLIFYICGGFFFVFIFSFLAVILMLSWRWWRRSSFPEEQEESTDVSLFCLYFCVLPLSFFPSSLSQIAYILYPPPSPLSSCHKHNSSPHIHT